MHKQLLNHYTKHVSVLDAHTHKHTHIYMCVCVCVQDVHDYLSGVLVV